MHDDLRRPDIEARLELFVRSNPLLPLADFDGLRTFESELSSGPGASTQP